MKIQGDWLGLGLTLNFVGLKTSDRNIVFYFKTQLSSYYQRQLVVILIVTLQVLLRVASISTL